jgi:uncharacterized membrane protein YkoI
MIRGLLLAWCLLLAAAGPLLAAERNRCLTPEERRAKIASRSIIPLAKAMRALKAPRRELVRASLCERNERLVYVLTLLGRDGKVTRAAVDADTGTVIVGR